MKQLVLILPLLYGLALGAADNPVTHRWQLVFTNGRPAGTFEVEMQNVRPNPREGGSVVFYSVGGSRLTAKWAAPATPTKAFLELEHLSSGGDIDWGGVSPVTIRLNGGRVAESFDPGSHQMTVARFEVSKFLRRGENALEIALAGGRTAYWLKRIEIAAEFPEGTQFGGSVERLPAGQKSDYAVVVSRQAFREWRPVVEALQKKHKAVVIVYPAAVSEAREELARVFPRYACFVEPLPDRAFVLAVQRLTRALDDDPYTDCIWGILTGYDLENARQIAEETQPLRVRRGLAGTGLPLDRFAEGAWYSETEKGVMWEKKPGGKPEKKTCPDDSTASLVEELNRNKPDLILTSGHATQRDWQIGYSYKNGQFRCDGGQMFGLNLAGQVIPIRSPNPKVYLAAGNCLMGNIPDRNSMALAWMRSVGVRQMVGYTVSTWYGYGAWGVNDYFLLDGRHTFAESFFFAHQSLLRQIQTRFPEAARLKIDEYGLEEDPRLPDRLARELGLREREALALLWHRDSVVFYGDPAWEARVEKTTDATYDQQLTETNGTFTFTATSRVEGKWNRGPAAFLPSRVKEIKLLSGAGVVTDNFVMMDPPEKVSQGQVFRLVFSATPVP
jgi:hypothetical protein